MITYSTNVYPVYDTYSHQFEMNNQEINNQEINNQEFNSFDCFEDKKERKKFIKKTLCLFLLGILSTFGTSLGFRSTNGSKNLIESEIGQALTVISFVSTITTVFITMCCDYLLRRPKIKYIIYLFFIFGVSWTIGITSIFIKSSLLIAAILITTGITTTLTLYSLISTSDFTGYTEYYVVGLFAIILTGTINVFLQNSFLQLLITGFGCIVFSFMIIYDIQMIIAQKHIKYKFTLDDSVLAAISLYIDTVNLFIYILQFLTLTDKN